MKMFNHLKHLNLNKVYLKYFGIPQELFEVAQLPGKLETSPGNKFGEKDTLNAYLLTPPNIPFFSSDFGLFDTLNAWRAWRAIIGKKYPFYAFSWSRVCTAT